ncbi:Olfactory receptor 7E24 [Heterocephalus glaber]|uniref:Olfactory receptor 7E24 n=1 Tax=Heterocephalus glaber TaxID=10181 RepID=G5ASZ9_HETGA|nr:Olfactory receptor 7E24 [Heterocephalus glaber]
MYLVILVRDLLIILTVIFDSQFHTPIYLFLSNLPLADVGVLSSTVRKMAVDIQTHSRVTSYVGCQIQMSFFLIFGCMDNMLLTVMACSHFLAIRHDLHYPGIMNIHV